MTKLSTKILEGAGYTPMPDVIVERYGTIPALVFGVVLRHCLMFRGVCDASHETLATKTGLTRRSIINHIAKLIDNGLLVDTTPNVQNRPHAYRVSDTAIRLLETGVKDVHTTGAVGVNDIPVGANVIPSGVNDVPVGVKDVHPKNKKNKEEPKETPYPTPARAGAGSANTACQVVGWPAAIPTDAELENINPEEWDWDAMTIAMRGHPEYLTDKLWEYSEDTAEEFVKSAYGLNTPDLFYTLDYLFPQPPNGIWPPLAQRPGIERWIDIADYEDKSRFLDCLIYFAKRGEKLSPEFWKHFDNSVKKWKPKNEWRLKELSVILDDSNGNLAELPD